MADRITTECSCRRKKGKIKSKPGAGAGKRKRQTLVHNPEEEVWHEPYMNCLRKEFSQVSIPCDSKIELPWKDIALPAVAKKIRANIAMTVEENPPAAIDDRKGSEKNEKGVKIEPKESTGKMNLPWNDLLVMDTVVPEKIFGANGAPCDSTLEIPWDDLALDRPVEIRPIPEEEPCDYNDVEIPWDEILVPDRDGRSCNGSELCQTGVITPADSCSTSKILNEYNLSMIANTDSDEEDYETSSEGPRSPSRLAVHRSGTNFTDSLDDNIVPESNQSLLVNSSSFQEDGSGEKNDPSASYTVIGVAKSPRTDVAPKNPSCEDLQTRFSDSSTKIQKSSSGLEELEAQRTEYFVAPRVKSDANKSESLPVITIATPWGSYEYPDVRMPAERLVSDSEVDIKDKMRLIAACMDGCSSLATSRGKFIDESELECSYLAAEVGKDELYSLTECSKVGNSWVQYSRPETPRTPKLITVTSPKVFSEASNVLPIIRNPDLGSDCTFPPSPSGTSLPFSINDNAAKISSSFYHRDHGDSPMNLTAKKSNFDPLSRIEGELAPLQNELSEIRGKVRALNLDYNLSCIDGAVGKFPNTMNWMNVDHSSSHKQKVLGNYHGYQEQNEAFGSTNAMIGVSNFGRSNDQPRYNRYSFADRSFLTSGYSYETKEIENEFKTAELIAEKIASHPDVSNAQVFSSEDCEPEVKRISDGTPRGTDRNLSPIYVCRSTPSIQNSKVEIIAAPIESEDETESSSSCDKKLTKSPEIRLPDFSDKIIIVPISYLDGMPDPPVEPVFSFAQEITNPGFGIGHKVLKIEHPDASITRRQDESEKVSTSFSGTVLTLDSETEEESLSARKEEDDFSSVQENSPRASDRIAVSKFSKRSSHSYNSTFTNGRKTRGKTYIRGLISGPEDFL